MKARMIPYDDKLVAAVEEELDQRYWTGVVWRSEDSDLGLVYFKARGAGRREYGRPMFQIFADDAFSGLMPSTTPCQCDRFDQSWNCPQHPELDWDSERQRWKKPCQASLGPDRCGCDECVDRWEREGLGIPDSLVQGLFTPSEPLTPLFRTPPPPPPATCPCSGCRAERSLAERRAANRPIDGRNFWITGTQQDSPLYRAPDPEPLTLSDFTPVPTTITLEIYSETEQGSGPLAIEVEPDNGTPR